MSTKVVTKLEAYMDLLDRIKDPKRGFAILSTGTCTYDQNVAGGCAIGRFLPNNDAYDYVGTVVYLFARFPAYRSCFEDPDSLFWSYLQRLHDDLGTLLWRQGALTLDRASRRMHTQRIGQNLIHCSKEL